MAPPCRLHVHAGCHSICKYNVSHPSYINLMQAGRWSGSTSLTTHEMPSTNTHLYVHGMADEECRQLYCIIAKLLHLMDQSIHCRRMRIFTSRTYACACVRTYVRPYGQIRGPRIALDCACAAYSVLCLACWAHGCFTWTFSI